MLPLDTHTIPQLYSGENISARELECPIVTRDRQILDYADGTSLHALAC